MPSQGPPRAEFLTVAEVAGWLRVCPQTIRRYIQSGEIYAWNVGSLYKIPYSSVIRFLEEQRARVKPAATTRPRKGTDVGGGI